MLVHNDYGKRSGEEAVVDKMADIFASLGHETAQLRMSTASARESLAGKIRVFTAGISSPSGVRAMREALEREKPDLVNVHNLYPFISPAALRECRRTGVSVVMTVHNFRLICPTGLFMREGAPCELCLQRGDEWGCVRHNCENSRLKSVAYAARNAVARLRRHYLDCVDMFACITDFQRRKLSEAGFPAEKLTVIPNSIELTGESGSCGEGENGVSRHTDNGMPYIAFCGRISKEKGIDLIAEVARRHPEIPFRLAGAVGDQSLVADLPENVRLMGFMSGSELDSFYDNSLLMVMASRWYEGFPMAILEAGRHSKATVAPDHGGFTEIITALGKTGDEETGEGGSLGDSLLFEPGDADSLEMSVTRLWNAPDEAQRLGILAHNNLKRLYTTEVVAQQWRNLLEKLVDHPFP